MKKLLPLLCFMFLLASFDATGQNLLSNSGFETWSTGRPSGWTVTNAANGTLSQGTLFSEGTKSCSVVAAGSFYELYQQVAVIPGKTYTLSISYYVNSGDGTDAGIWSYFKTAATGTALPLSLSDSLLLKGPGGASAFLPTVKATWKTYTCSVVAPQGATVFRLGFRTYRGATVSWDNFSFVENTTPTINKSTASLTGFNYNLGAGPSVQQSFTISGSNLTSGIIVTPPDGYEISATSGSGFTSTPKTLGQAEGTVNPLTLYVRLKAGLPAGDYAGNITMTSPDAVSQDIALSGSVVVPPVTLTTSVTGLTGFKYTEGSGPSTEQTFKISGTNLTSGITITPSEGYEISVISGSNFSSTTKTIGQSGGTVSETTFYVRLKANLTAATYNGTITISTTGGTKTIALSGAVIGLPGISTSTGVIPDFSYMVGNGPSAVKSFNVGGSSLSSLIIITSSDNYEISDSENPFVSTGEILLVPLNGNLPSVPVYVRLKAGLPVDIYDGAITISSTGSTTKTIALAGNVLLSTSNAETGLNTAAVRTSGNDIMVNGTVKGEPVTLYTITGIRLRSVVSNGDEIVLPASRGSVYVVRTATKSWKVAL